MQDENGRWRTKERVPSGSRPGGGCRDSMPIDSGDATWGCHPTVLPFYLDTGATTSNSYN